MILIFILMNQFISYSQIRVASFKVQDQYLQNGKILIKNATTTTQIKIEVQFSTARDSNGNPIPSHNTKIRLATGSSSGQIIYLSNQEEVSSSEFSSSVTFITKIYTINIDKSNLTGNLISLLVKEDGFGEGEYTGKRYNYVLETPPSSPIFNNVAKSYVFYKNTCNSASQDGSAVTYTISANTYTSTISQADADRQAEYALFFGGQNYANANGICTINSDKIITFCDFPMYSDTFAVNVLWNSSKITATTVSFEVYQYGIFKGIAAANVSNNGSAILNIIQFLQFDGNTMRNVRLKIISDNNPTIYEYTPGVDWFVD